LPKRDRRDLAAVLLRRAEEDQFVVRELCGSPRTPDSVLGFHAQQAAEKLINAVLAANEIDYERSHSLRYLADLLDAGRIELPVDPDELDALTGYAVELRYDDPFDHEELDRDLALELVDELVRWARGEVERRGPGS